MIFHLRYGVILLYNKTKRFIIATINTENYPLIFLRKSMPYTDLRCYSLYRGNALTLEQANEILKFLSEGNTRKAGTLFKRYFKGDEPDYSNMGPVMLDDMIPDEWYDVWKEMEGIITSTRHFLGYFECDVEERVP